MRPIWIIGPIAALSLITSASAQQVDQSTRQQIERILCPPNRDVTFSAI